MIIRAAMLALGLTSGLHAQSTPIPQSVAVFLDDPAAFDGDEVSLVGFLSLEDYAKALFATVDDYEASRFGQSVPVILNNYYLDRRELYERHNVHITGVYDHACAREGNFCSAHPGQGRIYVSSLDVMPDQPGDAGWRPRQIHGAPHALTLEPPDSALAETALALFMDIGRRNRVRLRNAASGEGGSELNGDLNDPQSRSTWLLFSGEGAYANWIEDHPNADLFAFTLAGDTIEPRLGAACLCAETGCAPVRDLQADRVTNRNLSDNYICLTFAEREAGWEIDPGMLLSMRRMGDHGNDLGVVLENDEQAENTLVWRWVTTPGLSHAFFITRMRNQPRPRVWYAVEAGEAEVGVFVTRPDGDYWSMDPNDGNPAITLQASLPGGAPDVDNFEPGPN